MTEGLLSGQPQRRVPIEQSKNEVLGWLRDRFEDLWALQGDLHLEDVADDLPLVTSHEREIPRN